ncbi:EamA family transporter [Leptolyngbya sp. FACHB-541]|uniref:EamA family transporter n=1 Tax=Leptolyngbya sp. FACHB-541 TaxID=2692810 RepID=UPI001688C073|nr:EamA family transporter [Leptolyngbya sp. FACHB-541]
MTSLALSLVVAAAFIHASWNFLAKRVSGGVTFVWLFGVLSTLLYAPLAIAILVKQHPHLGWEQLSFMVGSGAIHAVYFLLLQQGYRVGDLSLVYPLARGTGPMLSTVGAIVLFGEHPTPIAIGGTVLIAGGIFLFTSQVTNKATQSGGANLMQAISYALLTGACIATYTLWDKYAVSQLAVPPLLQDWASNLTRAALVTPFTLSRLGEVKQLWQTYRREVVGVAVLSPLSYILVLTALTFSPVSYIAPAREISIVIGALMGTQLLAEGNAKGRLIAASLMVLGVIALAIG